MGTESLIPKAVILDLPAVAGATFTPLEEAIPLEAAEEPVSAAPPLEISEELGQLDAERPSDLPAELATLAAPALEVIAAAGGLLAVAAIGETLGTRFASPKDPSSARPSTVRGLASPAAETAAKKSKLSREGTLTPGDALEILHGGKIHGLEQHLEKRTDLARSHVVPELRVFLQTDDIERASQDFPADAALAPNTGAEPTRHTESILIPEYDLEPASGFTPRVEIFFVRKVGGGSFWEVENTHATQAVMVLIGDRVIEIPAGGRLSQMFDPPAGLNDGDIIAFGLDTERNFLDNAIRWRTPRRDAIEFIEEAEIESADLQMALGSDALHWRVCDALEEVGKESVQLPSENGPARDIIRANLALASAIARAGGAPVVAPVYVTYRRGEPNELAYRAILSKNLPQDEDDDTWDYLNSQYTDEIDERVRAHFRKLAEAELADFTGLAGCEIILLHDEAEETLPLEKGHDGVVSGRNVYQSIVANPTRTLAPNVKDLTESLLFAARAALIADFGEEAEGVNEARGPFGDERDGSSEQQLPFQGAEDELPAFRAQDFEFILRHGIQDVDTLEMAFQLLERLNPTWRAFVEIWRQLVKQREDGREQGSDFADWDSVGGETAGAFAIVIGDEPGAYSRRTAAAFDRRSDLGSGIYLQRGLSIFALIHELTHALPITALPPELAALPYTDLGDFDDEPDFEHFFHHLLNSSYQDESISHLAEALLFRDLVAAGVPQDWFYEEDRESTTATLGLYEEGVAAYLRSEVYIGRDHRSQYNMSRLVSTAFALATNPAYLTDPSLMRLLNDSGVKPEGDASELARLVAKIHGVLHNPTPETLAGLMGDVAKSGMPVSFDITRILALAREQLGLISGRQRVRQVSFTGLGKETSARVLMLAEARRQFNTYRDEFQQAVANAPGGDLAQIEWDDTHGLLAFHRYAEMLARHGDKQDQALCAELAKNARQVVRKRLHISEETLKADAARACGDTQAFALAMEIVLKDLNPFRWDKLAEQRAGDDDEEEDPRQKIHYTQGKYIDHELRLVVEMLGDGPMTRHIPEKVLSEALQTILNDRLVNPPPPEDGNIEDTKTANQILELVARYGDRTACEAFLFLMAGLNPKGMVHAFDFLNYVVGMAKVWYAPLRQER